MQDDQIDDEAQQEDEFEDTGLPKNTKLKPVPPVIIGLHDSQF